MGAEISNNKRTSRDNYTQDLERIRSKAVKLNKKRSKTVQDKIFSKKTIDRTVEEEADYSIQISVHRGKEVTSLADMAACDEFSAAVSS